MVGDDYDLYSKQRMETVCSSKKKYVEELDRARKEYEKGVGNTGFQSYKRYLDSICVETKNVPNAVIDLILKDAHDSVRKGDIEALKYSLHYLTSSERAKPKFIQDVLASDAIKDKYDRAVTGFVPILNAIENFQKISTKNLRNFKEHFRKMREKYDLEHWAIVPIEDSIQLKVEQTNNKSFLRWVASLSMCGRETSREAPECDDEIGFKYTISNLPERAKYLLAIKEGKMPVNVSKDMDYLLTLLRNYEQRYGGDSSVISSHHYKQRRDFLAKKMDSLIKQYPDQITELQKIQHSVVTFPKKYM